MNPVTKAFAMAVATMLTMGALAQDAKTSNNPTTPLVVITNEPAPELIIASPVPEALARGVAVVPYRVEHIRILPILGAGAATVSPRAGHLHVTVDDLPWHWADFGENTNAIVVAGLPSGQHKLTIELAGTDHHVFTGKSVTFTIPGTLSHSH